MLGGEADLAPLHQLADALQLCRGLKALDLSRAGLGGPVRSHPELNFNIPPQLFCMSWCPDFEFRGT